MNVKQLTIHMGVELPPFELHHKRGPRTALTNLNEDGANLFCLIGPSRPCHLKKKIVHLHLLSIVVGASSKLSGAETALQLFSR